MQRFASIDRPAAVWGVVATLTVLAMAVLGSGNLRWFDAALAGYLFGTLSPCSASCTATACGSGGPPPPA